MKKELADDLKATNLYTDDFIKRMKKAEKDLQNKYMHTYTTKDFLNSLQ